LIAEVEIGREEVKEGREKGKGRTEGRYKRVRQR
jgi:hypothetical protein